MMKYIGAGAFVPNIPARDLTDAEVKEFGKEALLATSLYVDGDAPKAPEVQKPKKKEGEA